MRPPPLTDCMQKECSRGPDLPRRTVWYVGEASHELSQEQWALKEIAGGRGGRGVLPMAEEAPWPAMPRVWGGSGSCQRGRGWSGEHFPGCGEFVLRSHYDF